MAIDIIFERHLQLSFSSQFSLLCSDEYNSWLQVKSSHVSLMSNFTVFLHPRSKDIFRLFLLYHIMCYWGVEVRISLYIDLRPIRYSTRTLNLKFSSVDWRTSSIISEHINRFIWLYIVWGICGWLVFDTEKMLAVTSVMRYDILLSICKNILHLHSQ